MSKEELLKIQTCTLKVDIHCVGCKRKVRKILQKIEGVYKVSVDSEQGKVTVSGNVDPLTLIKKLEKCGKPAQVWGVQPMNKQKVDNKNQGQKEDGENNNEQQKGGPTPQQFHKLQEIKGFQDLKLPPQFKDMMLPSVDGGGDEKGGQKSVKFKVPEIDESDDEYDDDEFDDDDYDEDEEEEEDDDFHDDIPMKKPVMDGGGGSHMGNMMMNPQLMKGEQMRKEIGNNVKKCGGESQNKSSNINVNGMPNMGNMMGHGTLGPQRLQPMMNQQRQLMNQQQANDNERFQPMMYARPLPDAIANYMQPPYPYPYPQGDPITHLFSDDNTSSCNLM